MEKYFDIKKDKHNIRCKIYCDRSAEIKKAVLYVHGFAGHKDNGAAAKFAERLLTKYKGIALVCFDLPCHGDDVKKKLTLDDCMAYIGAAVSYIKNELHAEELCAYATSFGGYLILKYISENGSPFAKIALRCPAVNMAQTITRSIIKNDELEKLRKGKSVLVGFDRKIEIAQPFLTELENCDISRIDFIDFAEDIIIIHGTKDDVVPFDESRDFADSNIIEFVPVENADHRFQNPSHMETATKSILAFFGF